MMIFDIITAEPDTITFTSYALPHDYSVSYDNSAHTIGYASNLMSTRHYLQAVYLGPATLESLEAYFRTNKFHITDSCGSRAYTQVMALSHGRHPISMIPADHMRSIIVDLRGDLLDYQPSAKTRNGGAANPTYRPIGALCNSLELLLAVKNPNNLQLTIAVSAVAPSKLEDILGELKKMRRRLITAGIEVRVTTGAQFVHPGYPTTLDAHFGLTRKDWQARVLAHRSREHV